MTHESFLNAAETADCLEAFVWGRDLSPVAHQVVFSQEAHDFYGDADNGVRIRMEGVEP